MLQSVFLQTVMMMIMIIYCPLVASSLGTRALGIGVSDLAGSRCQEGQTGGDLIPKMWGDPRVRGCPQACIYLSNPHVPREMNSNNNNSIYLSYDDRSGRVS